MSHNPEIREQLAEKIKKEREQKDKPVYLPNELLKIEQTETRETEDEKKLRRRTWRKKLGIKNDNFEYEDHRSSALEPVCICNECGAEATIKNQKYCEFCGSKLQ